MGEILIGTSSWADAGLTESGFYPPLVKTAEERLRYYAARFSIAEIDSSYHFFPTRHNIQLWLENTPADFTFDIRILSLFTGQPTQLSALPRAIREKYSGEIQAKGNIYLHHLPQAAVEELWAISLSTLEAFRKAGKLGAILFQFPPWFHPEQKNFDYLISCRERLADYQMAAEFRYGSWLEQHLKGTLELLSRHKIALVCVDEPQGFKTSLPPVAEVTAPLAAIRFHGRNRRLWEAKNAMAAEKFNYLYTEAELKEWLPKIKTMAEKSRELHIIFKNKHADFPVQNAAQLKALLGLT